MSGGTTQPSPAFATASGSINVTSTAVVQGNILFASDKTEHGEQRSQERGFSGEKINDIQENYSHKVYQPDGRTVFAKKSGNYYDVVITNSDGKVITTVGGNTKSLRNWKDVTKMLNNNGGYSSLPIK